ncbi:uncharacterized [Tachysurus ichikawai]
MAAQGNRSTLISMLHGVAVRHSERVSHAKNATGDTGRCGSSPESQPLKHRRGQRGDRGQLCSTQGRWVKNSSPAFDCPLNNNVQGC